MEGVADKEPARHVNQYNVPYASNRWLRTVCDVSNRLKPRTSDGPLVNIQPRGLPMEPSQYDVRPDIKHRVHACCKNRQGSRGDRCVNLEQIQLVSTEEVCHVGFEERTLQDAQRGVCEQAGQHRNTDLTSQSEYTTIM